MTQKRRPALALLLITMLAVGLTACGGKRTAKPEQTAANGSQPVDMTRPPKTIGAEREIVVESDPNETISFEEWQRRQQEGTETAPDDTDNQADE
jgi:hypothetical protein